MLRDLCFCRTGDFKHGQSKDWDMARVANALVLSVAKSMGYQEENPSERNGWFPPGTAAERKWALVFELELNIIEREEDLHETETVWKDAAFWRRERKRLYGPF
jgi:hypothetical protein